jgi:dipeptidyl aminopeptidase/acylaminoacyl peptidase
MLSTSIRNLMCAATLAVSALCAAENTVPMDAFFEGLRIRSVTISPDGRYLAYIAAYQGKQIVLVSDRTVRGSMKPITAGNGQERISPEWCGWANNTRLLCSFSGVASGRLVDRFYPFSRLVGVNADGSSLKVLRQDSDFGTSQFQDSIIDWTPDNPDSVLMQFDDDRNGCPDVEELNVYTGRRKVVENEHVPIRNFITDGAGHVRFGRGYKGDKLYQFAKLDGDKSWRLLSKVEAFSEDEDPFKPIAVQPGSNFAYAFKNESGREALWQIDLTDATAPQVLFAHPTADISDALFTPEHRLLGVTYETDRPNVFYTDDKMQAIAEAINTALPKTLNRIVDARNERFFIVYAESDVAPPAFYLLTIENGHSKLEGLGSAYPGLVGKPLAKMRPIEYPAQDGTTIPGYLSVPVGMKEQNLPLVVLPHGGPIVRDNWGFDPWVQFLTSRGYAVLQMNFRGSRGYGADWYWSAHQDWGGLTYSDITDATKWAIKRGIADPKRVCIVGASFGGYAALLGATRDSQLYQCAVAISGVTDLIEMLNDSEYFMGVDLVKRQLGTDRAKLKADSPRRHVENVSIPILLIHGDHDYTVQVSQTNMMASALKSAGKSYKTVIIKDADHHYSEDSDLKTLFAEMEQFLGKYLGTAAN